jgi:hypothetical protein
LQITALMRGIILFSLLYISAFAAFADGGVISPERNPLQAWEDAIRDEAERQREDIFSPDSPLQIANAEITTIHNLPEWPHGSAALNDLFSAAYHSRWYPNPNRGNYRRKAPWLYPMTGCYARAAHISAIAAAKGLARPGKIFAFGRLRHRTPYARNGRVIYWTYHVAAGYRIGSTVYVLDPGVSGEVLTFDAWLSKIASNPQSIRISFCDQRAYGPSSRCSGGNGNGAYLGHIPGLLKLEWSNLAKKGYSPDQLLGP